MKLTFFGNRSVLIRSAGWDMGILTVILQGGKHYEFYAVPEREFLNFQHVESPGRFFNRSIKNHYNFAEILC